TCDYCAESIGGLNRKAARCTQCEYTCHARCQIKVEPTCPGRDPDARSGLMALFGARRRKSQRHQRTASAASADSQASPDSSQPQSRVGTAARSRSQSNSSSMAGPQAAAAMAPLAPVPAQQPAGPPPMRLPGPYGAAAAADAGAADAGPADGSTVAVLYDFDGDGAATLSVRAGDRVRVVAPDADGSGWTEVAAGGSGGRQGMVPTSYLAASQRRPPSLAPSSATRSPAPSLAQQAGYVIAQYDFAGRDGDELTCAAGDRIRVVSRDAGDGWLVGALAGREGRLPASYVQPE
ncbi:Protein BZZ1, partial [Coemansia helicoidea]